MALDKIRAMIQPNVAVPDNTKQQVFEVFADKSKEGDAIKENALNLLTNIGFTEEDILELAMGSVGGGGASGGIMKALKGMRGSGLKGLAGKIGAKAKFPQGYGAPQSPGASADTPAFLRKALDKQMNPIEQMQNESKVRSKIQEAIRSLMNPNTVIKKEGIKPSPQGMRKVGIRG